MASSPGGSWSVGMNREAVGYDGFITHFLNGAPNLGRLSLYTTYTYLVEPMKHMRVNWAIFYKYRDWTRTSLKPTAQTVPIARCHSESSQFMIVVATMFLINHRCRHHREVGERGSAAWSWNRVKIPKMSSWSNHRSSNLENPQTKEHLDRCKHIVQTSTVSKYDPASPAKLVAAQAWEGIHLSLPCMKISLKGAQ